METREEKLATWIDPSNHPQQRLRVLRGSLSLNSIDSGDRVRISDDKIEYDQIEDHLLKMRDNNRSDDGSWHFQVVSLPRLRRGRLVLSIPKQVFQKIQETWNLHPRTVEVFLSNNGVLATFSCSSSGRTSLVLKVANSSSTGFDCASVTCDPSRRTINVLYHHLSDEDSVFATLLSTPERCIDLHFFAAALYRSHHQHIEAHRNTIDDTIKEIERATKFGNPGRLLSPARRPGMDGYPTVGAPKQTIQQLSYCQTDLAVIGHVARCALSCGECLVQAIDESLLCEKGPHHGGEGSSGFDLKQRDQAFSKILRATKLMIRDEVEYTRRRTAMILSQVEQMRDRTQSQTSFMLSNITQSDAEYTAAIAVDGKRDSIAMKTISILGIVYLPATFVATLFSVDMFEWGPGPDGKETSALRVSPSMWIYWAVTVPLTLATVLVWMLWSRRENQKSSRRFMVYRTKTPDDSAAVVTTSTVGLVSSEKMV